MIGVRLWTVFLLSWGELILDGDSRCNGWVMDDDGENTDTNCGIIVWEYTTEILQRVVYTLY